MIDLYPAYKPFRNFMRRFAITQSLIQLWGYFVCISENRPLAPDLAVGKPPFLDIRQSLHPWDLEILVREVILNADTRGSDGLHHWNGLVEAVNHIRRLEGLPYGEREDRANIVVDLQRSAHRQFRWQTGNARRAAEIVRVQKIFGSDELDTKVHAQIGMNMRQTLRLGMAVTGGLLNRPFLNLGSDYSSIGIPPAASRPFLERLTCNLPPLRDQIRQCQQYNDAWLYASFPLEHTPLIRLDPAIPDQVICPVPRYLLNRVASGVFYDIVNSDGFANAYGDAFQRYVGEVISATVPNPPVSIIEERPYAESKAKLKHGTDWIVSDGTGHLFIECKTKRLSLGSKNVTDPEAVARDLATMTQAIVQNYKNILDAQKGITVWQPDDLSIYPVIVTLEDWHLFGAHFTGQLHDAAIKALANEGIDSVIISDMPYTITSVTELESVLQVVATRGISPVFAHKTQAEFCTWGWVGFLLEHFTEEHRKSKALLFPGTARLLLPEIDTTMH